MAQDLRIACQNQSLGCVRVEMVKTYCFNYMEKQGGCYLRHVKVPVWKTARYLQRLLILSDMISFKKTSSLRVVSLKTSRAWPYHFACNSQLNLFLRGPCISQWQENRFLITLVNCLSSKTKRTKVKARIRHSKNLDTPLQVVIRFFLHSKTRKRGLVDFLAKEGLTIRHTTVDEIDDQVTSQKCAEYQNLGFVCPSSLQEGFLTTTAIDNIDKSFSSVTSSNLFRGTTISVFQHAGRDTPF